MKRQAQLVLFLFFTSIAFFSVASAAEFETPVSKLDVSDGDTIVFLGDSITHQCLYTQYVEDFFYTRFPNMRITFHNSGVGGAKARDALERFDRDVAAYKPKYVTVLLGMNDGRYQPYDEEIFQTYRRDMTAVVERITESGATPVLMTPTMFDSRAARQGKRKRAPEQLELYNSVLAYYGTWLREVAVESGFGFVDMYSPLNNLTLVRRKAKPDFTLIADAVHPGPSGQLVMAYALLDDMGLRKPLSSIRIVRGKKGKPVVRAKGGQVSDLEVSDDGLQFTWLAEGLPFVVPDEAQIGAKLLHLGHRMSREALEVHVLPPGRYALSIDGIKVGEYTDSALSRHVELQSNVKTPQYNQAFEVAALNAQRNAGPVKSLRNEWRVFQQHSRLAQRLVGSPEDAKLKDQTDKLQLRLLGLEDRIVKHEKTARELEDQIFKINQPKSRKWVLKRVSDSGKGKANAKRAAD